MKRPTKSWIFILSALMVLTVLAMPVNAEAKDHKKKSKLRSALTLVLNLGGNRYDRNRCYDNGRYDRYDRYDRYGRYDDYRYDRNRYDRYDRYDRGRYDDRYDRYGRYDDYRYDRYDDCGRSSRRSRRVYYDPYRRGSAEIIIVGRIPL